MAITERDLSAGIEIDSPHEDFRLIPSGQELLEDMSREVQKIQSGDRFWVKGLVMNAGRAMSGIIHLAEISAAKGADVRFSADPISLYAAGEFPAFLEYLPLRTPLLDVQTIRDTQNANRAMFRYLQQHPDISFSFGSNPSLQKRIFPFKGTDHSKSIIIGNNLYFGDKNYDEDSFFNRAGFVVKTTDPKIAEMSAQQLFIEPYSPEKPDQDIRIDSHTELIIDSGKPCRSLIYERAIDMVEDASTHIGMVTTTLPGKRLMDAVLEALERNITVDITTTRGSYITGIHSYLIQRIGEKRLMSRKQIPNITFLNCRNRAKVLYTESQALWGSHNLVEEGIILGTREADILTSNKDALTNIRNYHLALKASKTAPLEAR